MDTNKNARFLVDDAGNKVAVVLNMEAYEALIRRIEDLEDEREAQDRQARKAAGLLTPEESEQIPFDRAVEEIEAAWAEVERS